VKEREAAARVETLAAAAICLLLAVYDRESKGPRLLCLPLWWPEEVGISDLRSVLLKGPYVKVWPTCFVVMVAMTTLCGTRIRYCRLLIHLVGSDLAGSVEEGGYSSGRFGSIQGWIRVVDLGQSTYFTSLVLEASDQFKDTTATISLSAARSNDNSSR
jgi:hypothetical protein